MRMIAVCSLLAASILAGCSAAKYKAAMPDVSANCVEGISGVPSTPMRFQTPDETLNAHQGYVEFASIAHCYRPADGPAVPVVLDGLESVPPPAEVNLSVQLSPGGTFAAALDVLDAERKSIRRYGFDAFTRRGSAYSLEIFLNSSDQKPAYLLLTPDLTHVGREDRATASQSRATPIFAGLALFTYYSSTETQVVSPLLEGGQVRVVARPYRTDLGSH